MTVTIPAATVHATTANAGPGPDEPVTDAAPHLAALAIHGDTDSFPTHAELVRTLLAVGRFATLTTLTAPAATTAHADGNRAVHAGSPYGSLVAYSVLDDGSPLLCISELAEHTRNARVDPRAGALVSGLPVDASADPLDRPRASLVGRLEPFLPAARDVAAHAELHPGVAAYAEFPDFGWWRLAIDAARYVGGFGHMSWITGDEIARATPDAVLAGAQAAVDHLNADHADALLDMARWLGGARAATAARVHSIDRHGLTLYADVPAEGPLVTVRVAFAGGPLVAPGEVRPAVVALARQAAQRARAAT